jgi:hypothetical protein
MYFSIILSILIFMIGCDKYDSAGTFSYTMRVFNQGQDLTGQDLTGQDLQSQGIQASSSSQRFEIVTAGLGSGVVSGYGYNQGLYVLAYTRIKKDGEDRDLFLSFDIPISADQELRSNQAVLNVYDLFAELVEERAKDGQMIYQNAYPRDGRFFIQEIYFNNEGVVGVDMRFDINFGDRLIENGYFRTKDSAQDVKDQEAQKNKE